MSALLQSKLAAAGILGAVVLIKTIAPFPNELQLREGGSSMSDITASAAMMRRGNRSAFHSWKRAWVRSLRKYWQLYLLLIPVVVYYIMFKYVPMAGVQIAFKEFSFRKGIWGSALVGLEHFERFFSSKK